MRNLKKESMALKNNKIINYLIYDGDCLFCNLYISKICLDKALGGIQLINARESIELANKLFMKGYDINSGMILAINSHCYHGSDCMQKLALMTTSSSAFNKLNAFLFKRPRLAKLLYPVLVLGRNLTLFLLGKDKIQIKQCKKRLQS